MAFLLGLLARGVGLPPLVGFLATGFALNYFGVSSGETLEKLADLGITLLLSAVGLNLKPKTLIRPQVWSVTVLHMLIIVVIFAEVIFSLALIGTPLFSMLDLKLSILIAFSLSFSSTVFIVKSLEDKGRNRDCAFYIFRSCCPAKY